MNVLKDYQQRKNLVKDKVIEVLSAVMKIDRNEIIEKSSIDTVPNWDSISHMNLVMALEEEFELTFSEEQILEMLSVEIIIEIIKENTG